MKLKFDLGTKKVICQLIFSKTIQKYFFYAERRDRIKIFEYNKFHIMRHLNFKKLFIYQFQHPSDHNCIILFLM